MIKSLRARSALVGGFPLLINFGEVNVNLPFSWKHVKHTSSPIVFISSSSSSFLFFPINKFYCCSKRVNQRRLLIGFELSVERLSIFKSSTEFLVRSHCANMPTWIRVFFYWFWLVGVVIIGVVVVFAGVVAVVISAECHSRKKQHRIG